MATMVPESPLRFDSDADEEVQLFWPTGVLPGKSREQGNTRGREKRSWRRVVCIGVLLGAIGLSSGWGGTEPAGEQNPTAPVDASSHGGAAPASSAGTQASPDPFTHHVEERMADRRNSERQKVLVADTERLLLLAMQLKVDVDKSTKDQLSIDVVKRAEQIEKLARSVKEKMRGN